MTRPAAPAPPAAGARAPVPRWGRWAALLAVVALGCTAAAASIGLRAWGAAGQGGGTAWAIFLLGAGIAPAYMAQALSGYAAVLSGNARWQRGLLLHRPSFWRWMAAPEARATLGAAPVRLFWACAALSALGVAAVGVAALGLSA